jgi:hypothetical protein
MQLSTPLRFSNSCGNLATQSFRRKAILTISSYDLKGGDDVAALGFREMS